MSQVSDPWDADKEPEQGPKVYFGEVYLVRNEMYWDRDDRQWLVFDPSQHRAEDKVHQVKLGAICTKRDGSTYDLNREDKIEWTPSPWITIANKSLHKLGVRYTELDKGRWAKWEMVKTGQTYKSNTTDETIEKDFFSFLEFYPNEQACRAAEAKFYNRSDEPVTDPLDETMPMPEDTPVDTGPTRAELAGFLPMFWTLAGENVEAFYAKIAGDDALKNTFDSNSPEVVKIIGGAA